MEIDLHRPHIDRIKFACTKCLSGQGKNGVMTRVKEVVDVWFDSGSMPYAQGHWPFAKNPKSEIRNPKLPNEFPADYIVEAIDQTRGWFYTLLAVSTLLGHKAPYKNVISLGHLLDAKGEKMSKSKGNIVNPWEMIDRYGVDTLRWYFYTLNHPWDSKLFQEKDLQQTMRKFILTLWNSHVFYETYKVKPTKVVSTNVLDKWIISRLNGRIMNMTEELDSYDITGAGRALERLVVEDLSLWYIRRSRQRFQNPKNKQELQEASNTLYVVLSAISKLTAPFTPFLAEYVYEELGNKKESVHWQDWPKANKDLIDEKLETEMELARDIVAKGLAERSKAGIRVRQPLASLRTKAKIRKEIQVVVADELNVKKVVLDPYLKNEIELDANITPALRKEGMLREIIRSIQGMRKKAGYKPGDKVLLQYSAKGELADMFQQSKDAIAKAAGLKEIIEKKAKQEFDTEQEFSLDLSRQEREKLWMGIRKA